MAEYIDGTNSKKMRLACKIFDKEKAPHDFLDKFFPRELEILTKIENPHIIQVKHNRKMRFNSLFLSDWQRRNNSGGNAYTLLIFFPFKID